MVSINQTLQFLQEFYRQMEEDRAERRKTERFDANRFNPFRFFSTNENALSAVLAFLLNPNESHGQGDLLLNAFLKMLNLHEFLGYQTVEVTTEKILRNNRRHDVVLVGKIGQEIKWILSIENKLQGADDQHGQMGDYLTDLQTFRTPSVPYCLIYLPAFERMPSEKSIPTAHWQKEMKGNKAKVLHAESLIKWLDEAPIFAEKIKQFTAYFQDFLREEIMGSNVENNELELVTDIIKNPQHLEAALNVIAAQNTLYNQLIEELKRQLQEKCDAAFPMLKNKGWVIDEAKSYTELYMYLRYGLTLNEIVELGVGIEFGKRYFHNCYYGAFAPDDAPWENIDKVQSRLVELVNLKQYKQSATWNA